MRPIAESVITSNVLTRMNTKKFETSSTASTATLETRRFSKAKIVAQRLGVCPRTIFRWANDGKLARHKINARVVLFDEAEVLSLIEAARVHSH